MLSAQKKSDAGHSVHKIGGTSMTQVDAVMDNILVGNRKEDELYNRVFVVSAYGGFTDLLLENKKTGEAGVGSCACLQSARAQRHWPVSVPVRRQRFLR